MEYLALVAEDGARMMTAEALRVLKRRPGVSGGSAIGSGPPRCAVSPAQRPAAMHDESLMDCSGDVLCVNGGQRYSLPCIPKQLITGADCRSFACSIERQQMTWIR